MALSAERCVREKEISYQLCGNAATYIAEKFSYNQVRERKLMNLKTHINIHIPGQPKLYDYRIKCSQNSQGINKTPNPISQ